MANNDQLQQEFIKGQKDGIVGTGIAMVKIIDGTDKGQGTLSNRDLEKIRRVFLSWRDYLIENMDKKKVAELLLNSKKIMDS